MPSHLTDSTAEALAGVESGDVVREGVGGEEAGTGTVNTTHHRQVTAAEHAVCHAPNETILCSKFSEI